MKICLDSVDANHFFEKHGYDDYEYSHLADDLSKVIFNANQHLVIGLNNRWGEGKTTFLQTWKIGLEKKDSKCVYIDAFQYEILEDPFFPLCGEISKVIPKDKKDEFFSKAKDISVGVLKFAIGSAIKIGTSGLSDGGLLETSGVENDLAKKGSALVENGIQAAIDHLKNADEFKKSLESGLNEACSGKPLIVFIDELDRCRPDFALSFLERIKHLFDVKNIVFVLAVNRSQLYSSIRHQYSADLDPHEYCQKFFSFWTALPRSIATTKESNDIRRRHISYCITELGYEAVSTPQQEVEDSFYELADAYSLTLREIEKSIIGFACVFNAETNAEGMLLDLAILLSVLNIKHDDVKQHIGSRESFQEFFENSNLVKLKRTTNIPDNTNHFVFAMKLCFFDRATKKNIIQKHGLHFRSDYSTHTLERIMNLLELIQ